MLSYVLKMHSPIKIYLGQTFLLSMISFSRPPFFSPFPISALLKSLRGSLIKPGLCSA